MQAFVKYEGEIPEQFVESIAGAIGGLIKIVKEKKSDGFRVTSIKCRVSPIGDAGVDSRVEIDTYNGFDFRDYVFELDVNGRVPNKIAIDARRLSEEDFASKYIRSI